MFAQLRARLAARSPAERALLAVGVPLAVVAGGVQAWRRRKAGATDDAEVGASATTAPASLTAPTVAPGVDPGEVARLISQVTDTLGSLGDRVADLETPDAIVTPPAPTPGPYPMPYPVPLPRPDPAPVPLPRLYTSGTGATASVPTPTTRAPGNAASIGRHSGNAASVGAGVGKLTSLAGGAGGPRVAAVGAKVPRVAVNRRRVIGGRSGPAGARVV
jgi:hypothetical protein